MAVFANLILLIVKLVTNYERPSSSGLVAGVSVPSLTSAAFSNLRQKLAVDFLLLLLFPYGVISSRIRVLHKFLGPRTVTELNGGCPSESEIPIRDEPRPRRSEQGSQKNQESDLTSAASAVTSLDDDNNTIEGGKDSVGAQHGPIALFWSACTARRPPPSPNFWSVTWSL